MDHKAIFLAGLSKWRADDLRDECVRLGLPTSNRSENILLLKRYYTDPEKYEKNKEPAAAQQSSVTAELQGAVGGETKPDVRPKTTPQSSDNLNPTNGKPESKSSDPTADKSQLDNPVKSPNENTPAHQSQSGNSASPPQPGTKSSSTKSSNDNLTDGKSDDGKPKGGKSVKIKTRNKKSAAAVTQNRSNHVSDNADSSDNDISAESESEISDSQEEEFQSSAEVDDLEALERELKVLEMKEKIRMARHRLSQPVKDSNSDNSGSSSSKSSDMREMVKVMQKSVDAHNINSANLPVFDGNPLEYTRWKSKINLLIQTKDFDPAQKLMFLEQCLSGKALKCVKACFMLDTPDAFDNALELLQNRFGDPYVISDAFRDELESWSRISPKDSEGLRDYADFLQQCKLAMNTIPQLDQLDDTREIKRFVNTLPWYLLNKWSDKAGKKKLKSGSYPSFGDYADFVLVQATLACDSVTSVSSLSDKKKGNSNSKQSKQSNQSNPKSTISLNTKTTEKKATSARKTQGAKADSSRLVCVKCPKTNSHITADCRYVGKMSNDEQQSFIKDNKLCFYCLEAGHFSSDCSAEVKCRICKSTDHPTCRHKIKTSPSTESKTQQQKSENPATVEVFSNNIDSSTESQNQSTLTSMILPVYVSTAENPDDEVLVYAMIDSMSDTSFIGDDISQSLHGSKSKATLKISTVTSKKIVTCQKYRRLRVRGMNSEKVITIPNTYTQDEIPGNRDHIPTPDTAAKWKHLSKIKHKLTPLQSCDIALLIGFNCSRASLPVNVVESENEDDCLPYAVETVLGWAVIGGEDPSTAALRTVNRITTEELTDAEILKCLEEDMTIPHDQPPMSQNDLVFMDLMDKSVKLQDGHYTMPLPFKCRPVMPDNRSYAMTRFNHLQRKLKADPLLDSKYREFMTEIIDNGEAELVNDPNTEGWYIPHHGVFHPLKPGKLRVVFDCSVSFRGVSLNQNLLQGPDLNNSLAGLLCRFRKEKVAVTCDIKKMFHQFRVAKEDRDYLRFLWFKPGSAEISDYHMNVNLFGATSSPSCAIYGLKRLANDNSASYPDAAKFIHENFYVDDGLISLPSSEEAIKLMTDATELCSKGSLVLHKFVSNDGQVAKAIGCDPPSVKEFSSDPTISRALGLCWNVSDDYFYFSHKDPATKPKTRHGVLSTVASVFDPLGLITPFTLKGKLLLQSLCKEKKGWDDDLSTAQLDMYNTWLSDLRHLSGVQVPRCYKSDSLTEPTDVQLHTFVDASTAGYGTCSYLRLIDKRSKLVSMTLVTGKARVAPKKPMTIPRLELQAAVLGVKVSDFLTKELMYEKLESFFWSDSQSVLGYISNEARRFHTFVCNRVQRIRDSTTTSQWNYISTDNNPADVASRGAFINDIPDSWLKGPKFLLDSSFSCPGIQTNSYKLNPDDNEIKMVFSHRIQAEVDQKSELLQVFEKYSCWNDVIRLMCCLLKPCKKYQDITPYSDQVFLAIVKLLQQVHFAEEIQQIEKGKVPDSSILYKLDPLMDKEGILRVGGRLSNSLSDYQARHPAILPSKAHITTLYIRHIHNTVVAHQGRMTTLNAIRSRGVHLLSNGMRAVSSVIYHCVKCHKLRGAPLQQKMADLPETRTTPTAPFTHTGIDAFGPITVKQGRKEVKNYGLIFSCFSSRAIHIELLEDMSTDSFINSLRCFLAIRGPAQTLYCDQGTNFVGARNDLKKCLSELDDDRIQKYLEAKQCTFIFNPPSASHFGGVWERLIRTVRNVMNGILLEQHTTRLSTQELRTLLYECMYIINSRPLTTTSLNQSTSIEPLPLTPNTLLTMKESTNLPPPGKFEEPDLYCRRRWRRVQYLAEQFWSRWKCEYLQSLQTRTKWNKAEPNIRQGDIVMIKEDSARTDWRLGRVSVVYPSKDGLVRKVSLHVGNGQYLDRPIHKLVHLLSCYSG